MTITHCHVVSGVRIQKAHDGKEEDAVQPLRDKTQHVSESHLDKGSRRHCEWQLAMPVPHCILAGNCYTQGKTHIAGSNFAVFLPLPLIASYNAAFKFDMSILYFV